MTSMKEAALARRERIIKLQTELSVLHDQIARQRSAISADLANGYEADYSADWWAEREEMYGLLREHLNELFPQ